MQLLLALVVACLLVAGQSLWKVGLTNVLSHDGSKITLILTNIPIIAGVLVYAVATLLYMYVLSKYKYATSYALIVAFSLTGATLISTVLFNEKIYWHTYLGFILILVGVYAVAKK